MAPAITLYSHKGPGPNPLKTAIVLKALGVEYDVKPLVFGDGPGGVKNPEFLKINPNGRVPAIVDHTNNDFVVWESGATMYYIAEKFDKEGKVFGKNLEEKSVVMQWLIHQVSGLGPVQGNLNYLHLGYFESALGEKPQPAVYKRFELETQRLYQVLEDQLARQAARGSHFVALDRPTLADYSFYPWVRIAAFAKVDLNPYPNVQKWAAALSADSVVQAADASLPKE